MQFRPPRLGIAVLLLLAPLLAGCLERGQPTMADTSGDDDAFCRANNVAVGSSEYVACRRDRGVLRNNRKFKEAAMNEDVFNTSLRKFLKKVGITSQREIEMAVRDAVKAGHLKGHEKLPAKMVLTLGGISLTHEISDEIELG